MATNVAKKPKAITTQVKKGVIDLCCSDDDTRTKAWDPSANGRKRKLQQLLGATEKIARPFHDEDAIVIDDKEEDNYATDKVRCQHGRDVATAASANGSTLETKKRSEKDSTAGKQDEETAYLQALGPIRMGYTTYWTASASAKKPLSLRGQEHAFASQPPPTNRTHIRKLCKELLEYQLNLPIHCSSSIFVRAQENRQDLVRVMITGPENTPYHHGCFFFDVFLHDYPNQSPKVQFLTTANGKVRFNPNLYQCGKVCLSLLGTWSGPGWISGKSTLLQVLISIQGLILVSEPYFNEPGYSKQYSKHRTQSKQYSKGIRHYTLRHAIDIPLQQLVNGSFPMPEFSTIALRHFAMRANAIRKQMDDWCKGNQALSVVQTSIKRNLTIVEERCQHQQQIDTRKSKRTATTKGGSLNNAIILD